jgi:hypothetical protein
VGGGARPVGDQTAPRLADAAGSLRRGVAHGRRAPLARDSRGVLEAKVVLEVLRTRYPEQRACHRSNSDNVKTADFSES